MVRQGAQILDSKAQVRRVASSLFLIFLLMEVALLIADVINYNYYFFFSDKPNPFIDITLENNIPTYYASFQVLLVGLCAFAIAISKYAKCQGWKAIIAWVIIAVFFVYMAVDDLFVLHEQIATVLSKRMDSCTLGICQKILNFPSYYWQVIFAPLFGGMGLFMTIFIFIVYWKHFKPYLFLFYLGLFCYAFAIGLDYLEGTSIPDKFAINSGIMSVADFTHLQRAVEEFIEMLGTTCIFTAFFAYFYSAHR